MMTNFGDPGGFLSRRRIDQVLDGLVRGLAPSPRFGIVEILHLNDEECDFIIGGKSRLQARNRRFSVYFDLETLHSQPESPFSGLIEEVQVLGVRVQGSPQGGIIEDLTQLLGALGVEIPEVGI